MDSERTNFYAAADRAIKEMNRDSLKAFGKMKMADWDQMNVIRTVKTLYRRQKKKAARQYYEVAIEAYIIGLMLCGMDAKSAHRAAEEAIDEAWIATILEEPDGVTGYRFDRETERKAERLTEALTAVENASGNAAGSVNGSTGLGRNAVIDKALRDWSRQTGQYAISVTDEAMLQAYLDMEIRGVVWRTERDERVCDVCRERDGRRYEVGNVPEKPHWNCRCRLVPVGRTER